MSSGTGVARIITLTHEFYPRRGGIATYVQSVASAAHAAGASIEVWAPAHAVLDQCTFPFPIHALPVRGSEDWSCRLRLAAHLGRHRALWRDATVYLPEPGPIRAWMYLQLIAGWRPRRLVITLHGSEILRVSRPLHRRVLFGRLLGAADRIGVVSRYGRELLLERFPEIAGKIVIAHGAPGEVQAPPAARVGGDRRVRVLTVGRIHPRKGQREVAEALAALPETIRGKVEWRLAGPIGRRDYALEVLRAARRGGVRIRRLGSLSDESLRAEYAGADLFAMTSVPSGASVEGFGLVYLEAAAHGLPVVAHRTGGVADAVNHGRTGFLVDTGDRAGLAHAIERLVGDASLREAMGTAGREWAARFSWARTASALFDP